MIKLIIFFLSIYFYYLIFLFKDVFNLLILLYFFIYIY